MHSIRLLSMGCCRDIRPRVSVCDAFFGRTPREGCPYDLCRWCGVGVGATMTRNKTVARCVGFIVMRQYSQDCTGRLPRRFAPRNDRGRTKECRSYDRTLPQSEIRDFCQPCRARAPFVREADIFPANGEIHPHRGGRGFAPRNDAKSRWGGFVLSGGLLFMR